MGKYLVGLADFTLNQLEADKTWGIIKAKDEEEAFSFYTDKIYSNSWFVTYDISVTVFEELLKLTGKCRIETEEEHDKLLLQFFDGNLKFFDVYKTLLEEDLEINADSLSKDMIIFLARKTLKKDEVTIIEL